MTEKEIIDKIWPEGLYYELPFEQGCKVEDALKLIREDQKDKDKIYYTLTVHNRNSLANILEEERKKNLQTYINELEYWYKHLHLSSEEFNRGFHTAIGHLKEMK